MFTLKIRSGHYLLTSVLFQKLNVSKSKIIFWILGLLEICIMPDKLFEAILCFFCGVFSQSFWGFFNIKKQVPIYVSS